MSRRGRVRRADGCGEGQEKESGWRLADASFHRWSRPGAEPAHDKPHWPAGLRGGTGLLRRARHAL
jgi:hypothetical protein